ncbi:MAG: antibiotic biosynthesis monooxygenase family protein [Candidatus Acidiferrum sp.]|jgi:quinol monooxygenase YgiN
MIIELMRISVPRGRREEFANTLVSLVGPIAAQPGCLGCRVFQTWPQREGILIEARWDSQEYLVRYLQSQSYKRLLLLAELGAAPPCVEFFTVVQFRGLDQVESARTSLG